MNRARALVSSTFIFLQPWLALVGAAPDLSSASASVKIILKITPRIEMRRLEHSVAQELSSPEQLCIGHIPAERYQVLVMSKALDRTEAIEGKAGYYCLPPSSTEHAGSVTIVAQ